MRISTVSIAASDRTSVFSTSLRILILVVKLGIMMMLSIDLILDYIASGGPVSSEDRVKYCQVPGVGVPKRNLPKDAFKMNGIPGFSN